MEKKSGDSVSIFKSQKEKDRTLIRGEGKTAPRTDGTKTAIKRRVSEEIRRGRDVLRKERRGNGKANEEGGKRNYRCWNDQRTFGRMGIARTFREGGDTASEQTGPIHLKGRRRME